MLLTISRIFMRVLGTSELEEQTRLWQKLQIVPITWIKVNISILTKQSSSLESTSLRRAEIKISKIDNSEKYLSQHNANQGQLVKSMLLSIVKTINLQYLLTISATITSQWITTSSWSIPITRLMTSDKMETILRMASMLKVSWRWSKESLEQKMNAQMTLLRLNNVSTQLKAT